MSRIFQFIASQASHFGKRSIRNISFFVMEIMEPSTVRPAGKAGEWYKRDPSLLKTDLIGYLSEVDDEIDGLELPIPGARIIIAP